MLRLLLSHTHTSPINHTTRVKTANMARCTFHRHTFRALREQVLSSPGVFREPWQLLSPPSTWRRMVVRDRPVSWVPLWVLLVMHQDRGPIPQYHRLWIEDIGDSDRLQETVLESHPWGTDFTGKGGNSQRRMLLASHLGDPLSTCLHPQLGQTVFSC